MFDSSTFRPYIYFSIVRILFYIPPHLSMCSFCVLHPISEEPIIPDSLLTSDESLSLCHSLLAIFTKILPIRRKTRTNQSINLSIFTNPPPPPPHGSLPVFVIIVVCIVFEMISTGIHEKYVSMLCSPNFKM